MTNTDTTKTKEMTKILSIRIQIKGYIMHAAFNIHSAVTEHRTYWEGVKTVHTMSREMNLKVEESVHIQLIL